MQTLKTILTSFVLVVLSSTTFASSVITGTTESKKATEKYSLKNLSNLNHKLTTFHDLRSSLVFKGLSVRVNVNSAQTNYLKYNKGNITYVIPYRHKVVLPRFKAPSPQTP